MKVIVDCSRINTGGAVQNGLAFLNNAASDPRHEWHVILSNRLASETSIELQKAFPACRIIGRGSNPLFQIKEALIDLPQHERRCRPDVVFSVAGPTLWTARTVHLEGFAVPHLIYPEIVPRLPLNTFGAAKLELALAWTRRRINRRKFFVVQSETVRQRLIEILSLPAEHIFTVKNSFSPIFAQQLQTAPSRPKNEQLRVFFPAAAYPHKNHVILPNVIEHLVKNWKLSVQFVVTLPLSSSTWRQLWHDCRTRKVERNITTAGEVRHQDMAALYKNCDLVFLPTLLECSSAVYPESFMAQVPVCTSDLDFAREQCGEGALYFNPFEPEACAAAIAGLLQNSDLRQSMIKRGAQVLKDHYPTPQQKWEAQLKALEQAVGLAQIGQA